MDRCHQTHLLRKFRWLFAEGKQEVVGYFKRDLRHSFHRVSQQPSEWTGASQATLQRRGVPHPEGAMAKESEIVKRTYSQCHFCGGQVSEQKVTVDYRWGEELITVIKNVPAGVCEVCGEKYFKADVVKAMEKTARSRRKPKEVLQVPVRELKVA